MKAACLVSKSCIAAQTILVNFYSGWAATFGPRSLRQLSDELIGLFNIFSGLRVVLGIM